MSTIRFLQILAVTILCFVSRGIAADKVSTFSSLPQDDELKMTFTTSGCFHSAKYELKFFRRSADLVVNIVQIKGEGAVDAKATSSTNRIDLGDLTLTKADVSGLDRLLEFYRSGPRHDCTTVDRILICQRREGNPVAEEKFKDGSCSFERTDLTRIDSLVARLPKPK